MINVPVKLGFNPHRRKCNLEKWPILLATLLKQMSNFESQRRSGATWGLTVKLAPFCPFGGTATDSG